MGSYKHFIGWNLAELVQHQMGPNVIEFEKPLKLSEELHSGLLFFCFVFFE